MAHVMDIRIVGPASPESVHVGDVLQFLAGIEKAAKACSTDAHAGLALVKVRSGSARYGLRQIAIGAGAAGLITYALASGSYEQLPAEARVGLRDAVSVAKRLGWVAEIRWDEADDLPAATITADTMPPSEAATSQCETVVYGVVEVVGGKSPAVVIRTDGGERVKVVTTTEQAKHLASQLYQPVRIAGAAEYRVEDMCITGFNNPQIDAFEGLSFAAVMGELRGALADGWSDSTVEAMLADLRGAEEEPA
jgi:hypothetical protein